MLFSAIVVSPTINIVFCCTKAARGFRDLPGCSNMFTLLFAESLSFSSKQSRLVSCLSFRCLSLNPFLFCRKNLDWCPTSIRLLYLPAGICFEVERTVFITFSPSPPLRPQYRIRHKTPTLSLTFSFSFLLFRFFLFFRYHRHCRLYKRMSPLVRRSDGPFVSLTVCPSVRPSVRPL